MQKPLFGQIIWGVQPGRNLWQAQRLQHLPGQPVRFESGPAAKTISDIKVITLGLEIFGPDGGDDAHIGFGMGRQKIRQPRRQPLHRKADWRAHRELFRVSPAKQLQRAFRQPLERVLYLGQIGGSHFGQRQGPRKTFKQGLFQVVLQQLYLFRNRRLCQVQFRDGIGNAGPRIQRRAAMEGGHLMRHMDPFLWVLGAAITLRRAMAKREIHLRPLFRHV